MEIEHTDIVVGIPSYNEADNIAFVASQVAEGLLRYFPSYSALIVNVDNCSEDGTEESFLSSMTGNVPKKYISTKKGVRGKGNNFFNLFKEVEQLNPKAIVVVDADLRSIHPGWVKTLTDPILHGFDYVTPIYSRNKYDGTITNHICYPLLYSLFNTNIRQPIAGDFSFSSELTKLWLDLEWKDCIREYGIDIFMTTTALLNGFKRCQVPLGTKVHKPSAPKLGPMLTQVVTTLFDTICHFKKTWIDIEDSKDAPLIGEYRFEEPQPLFIDYDRLMEESLGGFETYERMLKIILPPSRYKRLKDMYLRKRWAVDAGFWADILYDFISAYDTRQDQSEYVVESLKPLYFARVASFYNETIDMSSLEAEVELQKQAEIFRLKRGYLKKRLSCSDIEGGNVIH